MYHPDLTPPYGENWRLAIQYSQSASSGEVIRDEADGINDSQEQSTEIEDTFGLEFAAVQWLNLVSNAEKLFNNLLHSILLTGDEKEQIQRWLCLKQECEECVASEEATSHHRHSLERIDELTEDTEEISDVNEKSTDSQYESDTESDFDSHFPDFEEKLDGYMDCFKDKTDMLIGSTLAEDDNIDEVNETLNKSSNFSVKSSQMYHSGRRNSLHPGSKELPVSLLSSSKRKDFEDSDFSESYDDKKKGLNNLKLLAQACSSAKSSNNVLKALLTEMDSQKNKIKYNSYSREQCCKRISELEKTIKLKEKLITEIRSNSGVSSSARKKIRKKYLKLEGEYYQIKLQTTNAEYDLQNTHDKEKIDELKEAIEGYKKLENKYKERLDSTGKVKRIAEESAKLIPKIVEEIEDLKAEIKREAENKRKLEKKRLEYEKKIKNTKQKLNSLSSKVWNPKKELGENDHFKQIVEEIEKLAATKESSKKLQHLVQQVVGKEKQKNKMKNSKEKKSLDKSEEKDEKDHRRDIDDLRQMRTSVLDDRSSTDEKYRRDRKSSLMDDRKRLENDETIGAIDAVIEYKNELLSGRSSADSLERHKKEKGEQVLALLDRLSKISPDEIRALLYYFLQKIIDLRDSGRKIEQQLYELEREYDELERENEDKNFHIRTLQYELQMQRHETEQRIASMKQNYQMEKNQLLKQIAEESGSSGTDTKKYLTFKQDLELSEIREKKHRKGRSSDVQALIAATMRIRNKSSSPDPKSSKALQGPSSSSSTSTSRIRHEKNKFILTLEKTTETRKK